MHKLEIFSFDNFPLVKEGDDLATLIYTFLKEVDFEVKEHDIFVISHKIVSKAEGRIVKLDKVEPTEYSLKLSKYLKRDPKYVELVLKEAKRIIIAKGKHLITEHKKDFIYPFSGIDLSNVDGGSSVALLPLDADESAKRMKVNLEALFKKELGVIISDTTGRPFRKFSCNIAIGLAGVKAYRDYRGKKDLLGYELRYKKVAVADELASAAELLMGQGNEGRPFAIVRGLNLSSKGSSAKQLIRRRDRDLFSRRAWIDPPLRSFLHEGEWL
ncbi:MAG: coenzyme F420-0:L-glutamate ligase [Nitrososphaerales archaeon]